MWQIAEYVLIIVLLAALFALMLAEKIAETRRTCSISKSLGIALYIVMGVLALKIDLHSMDSHMESHFVLTIFGFYLLFMAVSDLIARPILRKRVKAPCVRVRSRSRIVTIAVPVACVLFMFALFLHFLLFWKSPHPLGMIVFFALMTISIIIYLILALFEKTEICGNGVWQYGTLHPWEEYESFRRQTEDTFEVGLASKSWLKKSRLIRLTPPPENRQVVQQLLAANLPDLSPTGTNL